MTPTQAKACHRDEQVTANFREALRDYSTAELMVMMVQLIEFPHTVEIQQMSAIASVAVYHEINRREMEGE